MQTIHYLTERDHSASVYKHTTRMKKRALMSIFRLFIRMKGINDTKSGDLNRTQKLAYEIIKEICASPSAEIHTFFPASMNSRFRMYIMVHNDVRVRLFADGKTQIVAGENFYDTQLPGSVIATIYSMINRRIDSKRKQIEGEIEKIMEGKFQDILGGMKK